MDLEVINFEIIDDGESETKENRKRKSTKDHEIEKERLENISKKKSRSKNL